ncbi:MAG: winged helix-turn-helix transcriptional regulator [Bacillus sp. (in: firmicutes)]
MFDSQICPQFEKAMNIISHRWVGLIIYQLLNGGPQRFGQIESSLPISGKVLSDRLKELEQSGIVKREVFPETPVRIEYSLTDKGLALEPVLTAIHVWAKEWGTGD